MGRTTILLLGLLANAVASKPDIQTLVKTEHFDSKSQGRSFQPTRPNAAGRPVCKSDFAPYPPVQNPCSVNLELCGQPPYYPPVFPSPVDLTSPSRSGNPQSPVFPQQPFIQCFGNCGEYGKLPSEVPIFDLNSNPNVVNVDPSLPAGEKNSESSTNVDNNMSIWNILLDKIQSSSAENKYLPNVELPTYEPAQYPCLQPPIQQPYLAPNVYEQNTIPQNVNPPYIPNDVYPPKISVGGINIPSVPFLPDINQIKPSYPVISVPTIPLLPDVNQFKPPYPGINGLVNNPSTKLLSDTVNQFKPQYPGINLGQTQSISLLPDPYWFKPTFYNPFQTQFPKWPTLTAPYGLYNQPPTVMPCVPLKADTSTKSPPKPKPEISLRMLDVPPSTTAAPKSNSSKILDISKTSERTTEQIFTTTRATPTAKDSQNKAEGNKAEVPAGPTNVSTPSPV